MLTSYRPALLIISDVDGAIDRSFPTAADKEPFVGARSQVTVTFHHLDLRN